MLKVRLATGGFRAVEVVLGVGTVAERLIAGLAAAAKRILRLGWIFLPFRIVEGFALGIGDNRLFTDAGARLSPGMVRLW